MRIKTTTALQTALLGPSPDKESLDDCAQQLRRTFQAISPLAQSAQPTDPSPTAGPGFERFAFRFQMPWHTAHNILDRAIQNVALAASNHLATQYLKKVKPFITIPLREGELPSQCWAAAFTTLRTKQFQPRRLFVNADFWHNNCKLLVRGIDGVSMRPDQASNRVITVLAQRFAVITQPDLSTTWPTAIVFDMPTEVGQVFVPLPTITTHEAGIEFRMEFNTNFATRRPYAVLTPWS